MSELVNILKGVVLFKDLSDQDLADIALHATKRTYKLGEYLYLAGAPRTELSILQSGEVEILQGVGEAQKVVARITEGNFVGEGAMLGEEPHASSCRAVVDTNVLTLESRFLDEVFVKSPDATRKILSQVARIMTYRLTYASYGPVGAAVPALLGGRQRLEQDLLGERQVPSDAYFGIQTLRAVENYDITGIPLAHYPHFIKSLAMVKKAAARANHKLGDLARELADAICAACDEVIAGNLHNQFVVDMIQGGAGTSTNMNANEVIANRALEILGHVRGEYQFVSPNDHVNMSQSTNDVYPTAIRLAILLGYESLTKVMGELAYELKQKSVEFFDVIKMGRTQLQDAVPMTLGQEFEGFRVTVKEDIQRIHDAVRLFKEINLGATAIGTGITAKPEYSSLVIEELCQISGVEMVQAANLMEATSDMGAFVLFSGVLKRVAVKISKICNDLRLLSSGPRTGLNEINLPPMAPGSSIMPGKVNPVIPEVVNQVAFQVIGNDLTVTMGAEAGQLQLNVMEPVIAFNIFQSLKMLTQAINTLTVRCIKGITANRDHCRNLVEHSIGLVTALNPYIGYKNSTRIAKKALDTNRSVAELVLEEGLLSREQLEDILKPERMTAPRS
ncbi:MAG: aspartate ammonia-lyase [Syntrophobacteraceae bacterium]|nr:aspartate ammonia-lyase [Syntrophobacteraceae bacterium]